jgi:hypothetical protein
VNTINVVVSLDWDESPTNLWRILFYFILFYCYYYPLSRCQETKPTFHLIRAALHLEDGPIRCVRGLKSSLVIGQKAQIGPNPFTPRGRAVLVIWFFKMKNVCYDTS